MGDIARGPRARRIQFVLGCWLLGAAVVLGEHPAPGLPAELWPSVGVGFIALTLVWDGKGRPDRSAALMAAALVASFWIIAVLLGHYSLLESGVMAVLNVGAASVMALFYARVTKSPGWAPGGARSLAALGGGAILSSTLVSVLGGFPDQRFWQFESLTLWWVIRSSIFAFIGGATFLTFFFGDRDRWRSYGRPSRVGLTLLVPVSVACVWIVFLDPDLPLSWFLLIPAVWAGVMLTPYGAAVHTLLQALAAAALSFSAADKFGFNGSFPPTLIVDLLLATCTYISLHIALLRDERERAISAERALRHEADDQSTLLGQIFDSMTDGIMLFGGDRRLLRHNPAARHLLGRPLPAPRGHWASYLGLSDQNGRPLEDHELPGAPGIRQHHLTVTVDHAADRRILDISSWPLPQSEILVLVTDVTNQRHRLEELSRFAGIVSHDLRTPLTSLQGWLELAREATLAGHNAAVEPLIGRAEVASQRMEGVIGGWINYTVVREGQLTPERIELKTMLAELTDSRMRPERSLRPHFTDDAVHAVQADCDLTRQLLANLIANAVKFSRPGIPAEIEISSRLDDEPGWIRIDVADHGVGLPAGQEEQIFEEFHRAPEHTDVEGTGLGLSVCRKIVARHGGSIRAFTNEHGGATVSLTLPAASP